jgi:hypothetical protein
MRLRSMLAAVAAVAALGAAPALADTNNSGYIGVSAANFDDGDFDAQAYSLNGAVAFPLSGNWGAQLDAEYARLENDADDSDTVSGTAHVFHRTDTHLIGVYVGANDTDEVTSYGGGVEGDLYRGDWTIGGRVSYATDDSDLDSDTWGGEARAKYFYTDNFTVAGSLGVDRVSVDAPGFDDFNVVTVGVGSEYQFASAPVSVFGGVAYSDVEDADGTTGVQIGLRYNWNGGSLRDRDRSGASLQGFQSRLAGVL